MPLVKNTAMLIKNTAMTPVLTYSFYCQQEAAKVAHVKAK